MAPYGTMKSSDLMCFDRIYPEDCIVFFTIFSQDIRLGCFGHMHGSLSRSTGMFPFAKNLSWQSEQ